MIWTNMGSEGQPDTAAGPVPVSPETAWDPRWPSLPAAAPSIGIEPEVTRAAYAFAARREDILQYIPCYCGCECVGHRSNLDCYVKGRTSDGHPSGTPTRPPDRFV